MKNRLLSILFIITIFGFLLLGLIIPDKKVSFSERRKLAQFPSLEITSIINGDFFQELNSYLVEQFPFRDFFKNIKGIVSNNLFQKKDEDGIFINGDAIYQLNSSINEYSVTHFTDLINKITENNIKTTNIYYTVIPDKNYFLDDRIPKLNYEKLETSLNKKLNNIKYINIFDTLNIDSYYKTDIHWKQESLNSVVKKLKESMNLENNEQKYEKMEYQKFYGALYGRIANNLKADKLTYLTNEELEKATVFDYEKQNYRKVYEKTDLKNIDSYDVYLGGAKSLLIIENKQQSNGKELILFRDSFGSSIAPLLISNYSKITLIDLRYLNSNMLDKTTKIEFNNNQDVLFMYSVPIINNSFTLK